MTKRFLRNNPDAAAIFYRRNSRLFCILALCIIALSGPVWAGDETDWLTLETRYTVIRYPDSETLVTFNRAIEYGSGWWAQADSPALLNTAQNRQIVQIKTDAIYERVQEILDMKKKMAPVTILVYPDKAALEDAFFDTYGQPCPFRGWYEFKTNTICLNAKDCHEGMLAHEIAHSVIDHFLQVRPPSNTAEILARYVDTHLK